MSNINGSHEREQGEGGLRLRGRIWWILYRADGKQHAESSKSEDKRVAIKMLTDRLADTRRGANPEADYKQFTFEQMRDAYLAAKPAQAKCDAIPHLDKFFGGFKVSRMTSDKINEFIEYRREEDEVADPTIRRNLVTLKAMFRLAQKQGKLGLRDVPYFEMPADSAAAGTAITPEQFAKILSHMSEDLRPSFQFLYSTGCRLGTAQAITWNMVNGACDVISVPKELIKARKPHTMVLAGKPLASVVAGLKKQFRRDGERVFDFKNYQKEWDKATAAVGLLRQRDGKGGWLGVRIHDLRVSFATNGTAAQVPTPILMTLGGWTTLASFLRYNIVNVEGLRAAMEQAGEAIHAAQGGK